MSPGTKAFGRILLEMGSITVAVVLGFAAAQWGEERRNRETGEQALAAIDRELRANLASVTRVAPYYGTITSELAGALEAGGDRPLQSAGVEGWRGLSPPLLRSSSFQLAVSTGALEHVAFERADLISRTYEVQSDLSVAIEQSLGAMVSGRLVDVSDWLRVMGLLTELTVQSRTALEEAVEALDAPR